MIYKLKDVFDLQMGKTPSRNKLHYWGGQNKWISIADIGNASKYIERTKESISDTAVAESGIKIVPKGTVIMSFKLSIGKTAITTEDMFTNEAIMAFIDKGVCPLDIDYFYHFCCGKDWLSGTNKAVMGLTLNKATLSEITISIPDIASQRKIAAQLDKIDELIAIRQTELELLSELVKSRFIEMFGDPVSNDKGWPHQAMDKVAPSSACSGDSSERVWLLNLDMVEAQTGRIIDYLYVDKAEVGTSTCCFDEGNVLYSKLRPYLNKVVVPTKKGYCTTELVPLRPNVKLNRQFLAFLLRSDSFVSFINEKVAGAKMPRVSMNVFREFECILPPIDLQDEFATFVEQVDKSKFEIQQSLEKLEILKKSLMQQYFG